MPWRAQKRESSRRLVKGSALWRDDAAADGLRATRDAESALSDARRQEHGSEPGPVNIPLLILTGADGAGKHAAALEAVGAIEKPFDPDQLLCAVRRALPAE